MELTPVLQGYALLVILGLPLLAVDEEALDDELTSRAERRSVYLSGGLSLLVLAGVTLGVAAWQGAGLRELGWRSRDLEVQLAWAVGVTVAGLGTAALVSGAFRRLGFRESPLALFLMPRTMREKRDFLLLVAVGAVCEELVYRGLALQVLAVWGGSPWMAAAITAVSFGLAHGYQRLGGIVRATGLGVLLAVPVVVTGSLFAAVAAHFWINAVLGLGGWRWLVPEEELPE